jgi:hypothetical protein
MVMKTMVIVMALDLRLLGSLLPFGLIKVLTDLLVLRNLGHSRLWLIDKLAPPLRVCGSPL